MKQSATLIPWVMQRLIPRCKSNVRIYLTMLFLLSGMIFVTQKSDAQCNSFGIDFKQAANRDGGFEPGQIHWINSILQKTNSRYIEGMSTLQRIIMNNLPSCGQGYHKLRIKMETIKGDNHAYDFLTSWDNAFLAAAAIAPGFDIFPASRGDAVNDLNECDVEIPACSKTACDLVTGGGSFRDLPIIDGETNNVIQGPPADQNTVGQIIPEYETRYGNRTVRVYVGAAGFGATSNGDVNNRVVFAGYGDANAGDGGDTYIYYDILWTSTSPDVVIEYGAHIAVGVDGLAVAPSLGVGYLLNRGASAISGGPYHCIVEDFQPTTNNDPKCEPNLGNLDNQLQGSEVLLIPSCTLDGPSAVCANGTATYTATVTNPKDATYLWEIINTGSQSPAASIIGTASGDVPDPIAPATTTPLSITVSTGGVGTYTVKLTINNGGQTGNTTDDDISSSCTVTTTVSGGPSVTCPTSTSTAACQSQAAVNAAYVAWLATVSGTGTITHNGGTVGPDKCGGAKTVIFTATNTCGTSTCSATFTVTAPTSVTLNCASNTTVAACSTQAAVDAAYAAWLTTASASGGCDRSLTNNSTGAPSRCGGSKTVVFTVTSSCEATKTCSASFTVTAPASVTLNCASNTTVGSCQSQAAVDAAYAAWLTTATSSGGCDRQQTNNSTGAPSRCGGSKTVVFTVTSSCEATKTCSASFTVTAPASVTLNCPSNTTLPAGLTQPQVDAAFAAWLATANASGGCDRSLSNNNDGAPLACGGSKTVTFTVTSSCEATKTCSATFSVTAPASTSLTCPSNTSTGACQSQAAVNAAYAAWLATVSSSGGALSNNSTGAPDKCGGSKTVTWTVTADCQAPKTCSATFTVTAPASVTLNCASNTTVASCQSQATVDAAYAAWLATANASGGCDRLLTNNSTGAPSRCGGSKTVVFTVTSSCEATKTCSASFTVTAPASVTLNCASNTTVSACLTQEQVDAAYAAWLGTANATGGCDRLLTNNSTGAPNRCGGSKTVVFTVTSSCEATKTCSASFTVTADNTAPGFTGSYADVQLACNPADPAGSLGSATATDACGTPTITPSDGSVQTNGCLRSQTRTFRATDACGNTSTTSRTVRWTSDITPPTISCAANYTATCGAAPEFGTATATDACGGATTVAVGDVVVQGTCPTTHTKTWIATDACGNTATCSQTVTVPCCAANCTYTQGAYGTEGGKMCDGTNGGYTTEEFIALVLNNLGGSLTVGCAGHSVTINAADASCVIDKLPGGGASGAIPAGDYNICTLPGSMLKGGRINNALLAQTITLGLNLGINGQLGNFALEVNKWLVTADLVECGSTTVKECEFSCVPDPIIIGQYIWTVTYTPYHVTDCRISQALYDALTTKNVSGLYALANSALCGDALPAGVTYSDITNAVDCINNAFDGCRASTGWVAGDKPTAESFCNLPSPTTPCPIVVTRITSQPSAEVLAGTGLRVSAYPNPFRDKVSFVINSRVSGQATLEVYNMLGQRIQTVYNGNIVAERTQIVEYKVPQTLNGGLIYIFKQGGKQVSGKLLNIE